ncbi:MAG TPA: aminotransferase class III-fold pyridoxal phosphate-dependent enzyme [Thermoanaerobaculia bacterium]|nr:aminotransferase class III-fold pyridoxal phosphate-dependent enzyme [Thermoanaerobaculia bacterium]
MSRNRPSCGPDEAVAIARDLYGLDATATELPSDSDRNYLLHVRLRQEGLREDDLRHDDPCPDDLCHEDLRHEDLRPEGLRHDDLRPDARGSRFVLKVHRAAADPRHVELETIALERAADAGLPCPPIVPSRSGAPVDTWTSPGGERHAVRLVGFLEGAHLAGVRQSPRLLANLGSVLARLDRALLDLEHPAAARVFDWDLRHAPEVVERRAPEIVDAAGRELVIDLVDDFRRRSEGRLDALRRSVVHGDANDYNVLVAPDVERCASSDGAGWERFEPTRISGLLDFGDLVSSWTVNDVAIAGAYVMLDRADPLAALAHLVGGYHRELPLTEIELALVFLLSRLRLCLSVAMSAHQRALEPDNLYLSISEAPAWRTLERLTEIHPRRAEWALRAACGLEPVPGAARARRLTAASEPAPVLGFPLDASNTVVLDLGIDSPILPQLEDEHDQHEWSDVVFGELLAEGAVGWGRWDEARPWYAAEQFLNAAGGRDLSAVGRDGSAGGRDLATDGGEPRTVHLGVDLFVPPGTELHAPLAGRVYSVADNARPLDYGPTLVIEHELAADDGGAPATVYTLWGHLARDTLERHRPGDPVARGAPIAEVGPIEVNGGWAPHLHVQVVLDLLDLEGDFPGVAAPSERELWLACSPDPNLLLRLPAELLARDEPSGRDLLERRRRVLSPSLSLSYRRPLEIARGRSAYLIDRDGRRYLDLVNNVCHVGHCHPRVVAAAARQTALLNTNTRYLHPAVVRYAERLLERFPEPLEVCFFVNSGSEANDLALRLARAATGRREVICLEGAYHGHLSSLIEVSPYKHDGPGGAGTPPHVHKVSMPDTYRGRHRDPHDDCLGGRRGAEDPAERYAAEVVAALERSKAGGDGVAAFLCESILSCGGQIVLPGGYLERCYRAARAHGAVCIADEVQVGFGRVGTHAWAFETQGVVPDVVTLGKPIGNGHPLAAVITTREIADAFAGRRAGERRAGMEYFNTYGGNPVSAAVGMAVLDVLDEEGLQERARVLGRRFKRGLEELAAQCPAIGDVRGLGLFLGFELVSDPEARTPDPELASWLVERLRDRGFLFSTDGPEHDVIKIKPPMVLEEADVDRAIIAIGSLLRSPRPA